MTISCLDGISYAGGSRRPLCIKNEVNDMNEFLELANQVNTIVVFDLIVMAGLWVVHDILKDFGSYIKEKIKSTQEQKVE